MSYVEYDKPTNKYSKTRLPPTIQSTNAPLQFTHATETSLVLASYLGMTTALLLFTRNDPSPKECHVSDLLKPGTYHRHGPCSPHMAYSCIVYNSSPEAANIHQHGSSHMFSTILPADSCKQSIDGVRHRGYP